VIAGHFGLAAGVKAKAPSAPLWALMLACQWLDVVFLPLFLSGVEKIEPVAGTHGGYGDVIIHADYTHSLVGALLLSLLFGVPAALRWGRRNGVVLAAVVFSHWLLDLVVHRGDLPLLPGGALGLPRLGLGLWRFPMVTGALELALVIGGAYLYWRAALAVSRGNGRNPARAHAAAAVLLASGVLTLALNGAGM
jgi:hypothetical protein